eukprot:TRINITY_DN10482_c0_g2_i5.p2 TRINITY_DN10482_c0_g2~~TRINITY_DN10482_c0_g2_i5.p2  ORF type:complete len:117 (-),score=12.58 TRINITY_DN10482_c0_g2_i5:89-439(-)
MHAESVVKHFYAQIPLLKSSPLVDMKGVKKKGCINLTRLPFSTHQTRVLLRNIERGFIKSGNTTTANANPICKPSQLSKQTFKIVCPPMFYHRLFPKRKLHVAVSLSALHWLSQVP